MLPKADPPFFFRRFVPPYTGPPEIEFSGIKVAVVGLDDSLVIYGYRASTDGEDPEVLAHWDDRGLILTESFSSMCPYGESGSQPLAECQEITEAEFESARARGWT